MNIFLVFGILVILGNIGNSKAIRKKYEGFFDIYSALKFPNEISTTTPDSSVKKAHQFNKKILPKKIDKFSHQKKNSSFSSAKAKRYIN